MKIVNLQKLLDVKMHKTMMLYGQAGVGKTVTPSVTHNKDIKVLYVGCEQGHSSLVYYGREHPDMNFPDMAFCNTRAEVQELFSKNMSAIEKYDVVVFDTISHYQRLCIDYWCELHKEPQASQRTWGRLYDDSIDILSMFRQMKTTVIVTCHEHRADNGDGLVMFCPDLVGGIKNEFGRYFDDVWRIVVATQADVTKRAIMVGNSRNSLTKTRLQNPPLYIEATLDDILKYT